MAELNIRTGLQQTHLVDHIQDQIGDLIDAVRAISLQPSAVDVGKIGVGCAFSGRDPHLGWRGLVVKLDPKALQQLSCKALIQITCRPVGLIKRIEMLVQAAGIKGIPWIELCDHAEMDKPVGLQRLMKGARRLRRHSSADLGDALQFALTLDRARLLRQPLRLLGITMSQGDDGLGTNPHGLQFLRSLPGGRIVQIIQFHHRIIDPADEIHHPQSVDLVVQHRMPRGTLLHELGEYAGLIAAMPGRRHSRKNFFPHGVSAPEGDDALAINVAHVLADLKRCLFPVVQRLQILKRMAGQFRIGVGRFRRRTSFSYNPFVVLNADNLVLHQIAKNLRTPHGSGHIARLSIRIGDQNRPLGR
ncbi:MAG: hypothetical protein BWY83_03042 [bacterium ADurb.Bin478]|nr:MAG: hypothetical protein BWY83_03042 [bacterium ADurb.Bin478]